MKRWIKWIGLVILIPVILFLLLASLLYIPSIQNFVKNKAVAYASKATGMNISVDRVRLSFPLDLTIREVEVISPSADTLLHAGSIHASVKLGPLFKKEVVVNAVDIRNVSVDSDSLMQGMYIRGNLGSLTLKADRALLTEEQVTVNDITLSDADIYLALSDTTVTPKDTAVSPSLRWEADIQAIALNRVNFELDMPLDTLRLSARIPEARLDGARIGFETQTYEAARISITDAFIAYDRGDSAAPGLDPNHIALSDLNVRIDSVRNRGIDLRADIRRMAFRERSGLELTSLEGKVVLDSSRIDVPGLKLTTPNSTLTLAAKGNIHSFSPGGTGELQALLNARIGKKDVMLAAATLPGDFMKQYPDAPLTADIRVEGNTKKLYIRTFDASLPGAFRLTAAGNAEALTDSLRRAGELTWDLRTENLNFVLGMLDSTARTPFTIPAGMQLTGEATLAGGLYRSQLRLTEENGRIDLTAQLRPDIQEYQADLTVTDFPLDRFLPRDSLRNLTAILRADGRGFDFFSAATRADLQGAIGQLEYGTLAVSGITLGASLKNNRAAAALTSTYAPAVFRMNLDGTLRRDRVTADLTLEADTIDLYRLHLMKDSFATAFDFRLKGESDLKKTFRADAEVTRWKIAATRQTISPKDIHLQAFSEEKETAVKLQAGDLTLQVHSNENVQTLGDRFSRLSAALTEQMQKEALDLEKIKAMMPDLHVQLTAGSDNPVHNFIRMSGMNFRELAFAASTSPQTGTDGRLLVQSMQIDTLQLDTVRLAWRQQADGIALSGGVINSPGNRQHVFTSSLEGLVGNTGAHAQLRFVNGKGQTGLLLGVRVNRADRAWTASFYPDDPILAFRRFRLIPDNYIRIDDDKKIEARFRMEGEDGAVLSLHSQPSGNRQNIIDLGIEKFNLSLLSQLLPYMPDVGGLLHADVQYAALDSTYHIKADVGIDTLSYEHGRLGDIRLNASYLPGGNQSHHIDAHLFHNEREVLTATGGYYQSRGRDSLQSRLQITNLPLWIANPFLPQDMASIAGALDGQLTVNGSMQRPDIDGYVQLDTASVFVVPAGTRFRFDTKQIAVHDSRFLFDGYQIQTSGKNPFVIDGVVDASDFARMTADLTLSANNMEVLNVRRNNESLVYGKVYIDLQSTVKGPVDALTMRGNIQLLGNTDVTYVLKDSPLTVQDRLSDIVTFVNFADTAQLQKIEEKPLQLGGLDMLMTIRIDQAVQMNVDLSEDRQSYVKVEGGGDLSFQYSPQGDMILTGRYTISNGTVRYALPVIPAKTFSIKQGSYVEWSGAVSDPYIDLTATERVRTSVTLDEQAPQMVNFDVSISVKNRLENLSLVFDLSAPENMAMENQLSAMSQEERSKQAISMLVTNMYMAQGSSAGKTNLNMGDALNSFLQKEIGNLAGSALKTIDVSFGMESYDPDGQPGGSKRTDYSFSFAKRFYNNRIQVIVGGRISTGVPEEETQSFIDNVSIEYRLDASGSRYIKLFHNKDYESILEGEITETGAGIVLRRKMQRLKELFLFKKSKQATQNKRDEKNGNL